MPRIDTYISEGRIPSSTGRAPIPMELGTQAGLISGSRELGASAVHAAQIESLKAHAQAVADQTSAATQLLLNLDQQARSIAQDFKTPYDPAHPENGGINATPQRKAEMYNNHIQALEQEGLDNASTVGGLAQQYYLTHSRSIIDPHITKFNSDMEVQRKEEGQLNGISAIKGVYDKAIADNVDEAGQMAAHAQAFELARFQVASHNMDGKEAATLLNTEQAHMKSELVKNTIRSNPAAWLANPPVNAPKEAYEYARQELSLKDGQEQNRRQEDDRILKLHEDINYEAALQKIGRPDGIGNMDQLDRFVMGDPSIPGSANMVNGGQYHTLMTAIRAHLDNVKSDPATLTKMYTRLDSPNSKNWPTDSEIGAAMSNQKLSTEHAVGLFNHLRSLRDEMRKEGITHYREEGVRAEDQIKHYFEPEVKGLIEYDKIATEYQARALRAFNDRWLKEKNKPEQADPMSWVDDIVNPYRVALARQGRTLATADLLRMPLPIEANTVEKVLQLRKQGRLDQFTTEAAVRDLRLIDTFDVIERANKSTTSTVETGVKRNR